MLTPFWLVATLSFGQPVATIDDMKFRTEAACFLYMRARYNDAVIEHARLKCVPTSQVHGDWLKKMLLRRED